MPESLSDIDFDAPSTTNSAIIQQRAIGNWLTARQPLCLVGDLGLVRHVCSSRSGSARKQTHRAGTAAPRRRWQLHAAYLQHVEPSHYQG